MDFTILNKIKNKESIWIDFVFYVVFAVLIAVIFSFAALSTKMYFQNKKIGEINEKIAVYNTDENIGAEKEVLYYKKKIEDVSFIFDNRKIFLNVFSFVEANTLPDVWFLNFDMSQFKNQLRLSGESEDMATFSHQVQVFEQSGKYVQRVAILSSEIQTSGRIKFVLDITLEPSIFDYENIFVPRAVIIEKQEG